MAQPLYQPISNYRKPSKVNAVPITVFVTNGEDHSIGYVINGNFHAAKAQFGTITHYAYIEYPPLPEAGLFDKLNEM